MLVKKPAFFIDRSDPTVHVVPVAELVQHFIVIFDELVSITM